MFKPTLFAQEHPVLSKKVVKPVSPEQEPFTSQEGPYPGYGMGYNSKMRQAFLRDYQQPATQQSKFKQMPHLFKEMIVKATYGFNRGLKQKMFSAIKEGNVEQVEKLLKAGASPKATGNTGWTFLMHASKLKQPEIVKILLKAGAEVNAQDEFGITALMNAVFEHDDESVKALLASGAAVNIQDKWGRTALQTAAYYGQDKMILDLLAKGVLIDITDKDGRTAISQAAAQGRVKTVQLLIEAGANINTPDHLGWTPLMYAVRDYRRNTVAQLIKAGADIHAQDKKGCTALTVAGYWMDPEMENYLIGLGANQATKASNHYKSWKPMEIIGLMS